MKVAWFEAENWHSEEIESDHEIVFFSSPLDSQEVDSSFDAVSICSDSEVSRKMMENVEPEKVLCRTSGYDNVNLEAADDLGITVQNTPDYGKESVAEYNFAMILNAAKNFDRDSGKNPNTEEGTECLKLKDKTLGVIGAGSIGKELLKRAKSFEMNLVAFDLYKDQKAAREIGYEYVEIDELLKESDIISINCALTDSTRSMISDEQYRKMDCHIFVNIARGEIIDTSALENALEDGSVNKAVLDVVEDGGFDLLNDRKDVTFTPHNAYNTYEAVRRRVEMTLSNLESDENILNSP